MYNESRSLFTQTFNFSFACNINGASYLKIGKVFLHKAIDLADREAASFAVFQSHCNQTAEGKKEKIKSLLQLKADEVKYTTQQFSHKSKRLCADL